MNKRTGRIFARVTPSDTFVIIDYDLCDMTTCIRLVICLGEA